MGAEGRDKKGEGRAGGVGSEACGGRVRAPLTADVELLPGAVVQALVKVEKPRVLLDADLGRSRAAACAVGAIEVLAQAEAGHLLSPPAGGVD